MSKKVHISKYSSESRELTLVVVYVCIFVNAIIPCLYDQQIEVCIIQNI